MNDVFDEVISRLKQKAIKQYKLHEMFEKTILTKEYRTRELWVRLEDVQKLIEEIKQKYAIIRKDDLASIIELFKSSPFVLTDPLIRRLEELLKE